MEEIARDADAVRARHKHFQTFVKEAWEANVEPGTIYKPNWHVDAIGEHLTAVHRKEIQRLQINLPPGMMKSTTVSVMFGPWEWGPMGQPWLQYLSTSYESGWATRDSRKHRDLVLSEWYQALYPLRLVRQGASDFENEYKGRRKAVPFKRLTGGRGNRLIVDDPHSVDGAESETDRETSIRRFRESATSRLNDPEKDTIIVMMHRLHPDDLCGMIEEQDLPYVKLILPMEYHRSVTVSTPWHQDPRTKENELLFPKHMSREQADAQKIQVGDYAWDTQYQQTGRSRDGATYFSRADILVRHVKGKDPDGVDIVELRPAPMPQRVDAIFAVSDTSTKTGKKHDGTGVAFYGYLERAPKPVTFVLDWDLRQVQADLLIEVLPSWMEIGEQLARECHATFGFKGIMIEDKDSGQALIMAGQRNSSYGDKVFAIPSESTALGKDGRAVAAGGYVRNQQMIFTERAYEKTLSFHGRTRNHFISQVVEYRVSKGTPHDEDEMFDVFCYGTLLSHGSNIAT